MAITCKRVHEIVQVPSCSVAGTQDMFELVDIQYGSITRDVSEALCSSPGDYLIRKGTTNGDFKLTIHQRSGYSHFNIYRERHPYSKCPFIYFLDDATKMLMIGDLSELVSYVVTHPYSYCGGDGSIILQPCSKQRKRVLNNCLITKCRSINVNAASSRRYYTGKYRSQRVVLMEKDNYSKVLKEVNVRLYLSGHPNILEYTGVTVHQPVYMVFPGEAQHSLHKHIKQLKSSKTQRMVQICLDTCSALLYIHSHGYIHRSIQTAGCIIDNNGVTKILDLSKTCRIDSDYVEPEVGESVLVPTRWAAPEVLQYSVFSKASDVWSFGVFVWEVFNKGKTPYMDIVDNATLVTELKPGFRLSMKKEHSSFDVLLECCFRYDASNRAGLESIHSLLQSQMH